MGYDEVLNWPWCDVHATRMYNLDSEMFQRDMSEYHKRKAEREHEK